MATEQISSSPEFRSIHRVATIPLVQDSLSMIHNTLLAWTPTAYGYSLAIRETAMGYSHPIQSRLNPLLVSADGYAMKGLDIAQERFPVPFTIKSEELSEKIKAGRDNAYKSITTPVTGLAYNVDASLAPIVDRLEVAVHKFNHTESTTTEPNTSPAPAAETTQVGRAYRLGIDLKDQILTLSTEQVKQLQSQYVIIQQAQDALVNLNASLAAQYASAKDKSAEFVSERRAATQDAAQNLMAELEKYQAMTMDLPKHVQASLKPVQDGIQASLSEISSIVRSELPVGEKVGKVGQALQENIQPLLEQATVTVQDYIIQGKVYLTGARTSSEPAPTANGDAHPESN